MAKSLEVQAIINKLNWADELGEGGKQRDVVNKAITDLVKYYVDLKMESGFSFHESKNSILSDIQDLV